MVAPFDQFMVPSLPHLAILLTATAVVAALLYAIQPPVTQRVVISFVPWIVTGATLYVFYQLGDVYGQLYPSVVAPLFSAPSVYLTTFVVMGVIWLAASMIGRANTAASRGDASQYLLATGTGIAIALFGLLVWQTAGDAAIQPNFIAPTLGLIISAVLTFVVYIMLGAWRAYIIAEARYVGALVLFAHVLDGITTTIGVDFLGTGEDSVLPRLIMDFAADLPTYPYLGSGWLFVVVKMLVAVAIIVGFADYVSEEPTQGNLLFAFIAAVGLGPAVNNLLIFMLGFGVQTPGTL
ncbi:DUF63 family protein [Halobacteriales archaeon Cl-PHB]